MKASFWVVIIAGGFIGLTGAQADTAPSAATTPASSAPFLELAAAGKLPIPTAQGGCAVIGKRLYAVVGKNFTTPRDWEWSKLIRSAELLPNGQLGPWRDETSLPEYLGYICQSVEVVNNRIYIIGGTTYPEPKTLDSGSSHSRHVYWTEAGTDGVLGPWQKSETMMEAGVSCHATCSSEQGLYLIGGQNKQGVTNKVWFAPLAKEGQPQEWKQLESLPKPLWFHGAAIMDDQAFVWGGLSGRKSTEISDSVYSAYVKEDGTFGPWQEQPSPMPSPVYSSAFCGFNDYLVCVAGRYAGSQPTNSIWFAHVENGRVGLWQEVQTNLITRMYHPLGLDKSRGVVYIAGGLDRRTSQLLTGKVTDAVQLFQIPQSANSQFTQPTEQEPGQLQAETPEVAPSLATALQRAVSKKKNVLAFFYSPSVPACKRSWDLFVKSPDLLKAASGRLITFVDVSNRDSMQECYRFKVFKVPSMIELKPDGTLCNQTMRLSEADHFHAFLEKR